MSSNGGITPGIARTMTGLLDRTRSRRTFTKDSFTSPKSASSTSISSTSPPAVPSTPNTTSNTTTSNSNSNTTTTSSTVSSLFGSAKSSKPKLDDVLAERAKLQADLEKAVQDCKYAEKGKADAERQLQDSVQILAKEREVSEGLRTERDTLLKDLEDTKKALVEAEERASKAEAEGEQGRLEREKLEEELREAERVAGEMKDRLVKVGEELGEADETRRAALVEAETNKQALGQALQLVDQYRTAADQLAREKQESEQVSRESLELARHEAESSKAALEEVERRVSDERDARERAERELRRRNEEAVPHTLFGYAMSTFNVKSRDSSSRGSSSSWASGCVIA